MSAPDAEVLRKVRQWVAYAEEDLRLAQHALSLTSGCPYRLIAYHAQQCGEKYLKAFLVLLGVDFPHTHNIRRLRELCEPHGPWAARLADADDLSVFAVSTRYPGEDAEVSRQETLQAIELAERIRGAARAALKARGAQDPPPGAVED